MLARIESLILMGFPFDPDQELVKFLAPDQSGACPTAHHEL